MVKNKSRFFELRGRQLRWKTAQSGYSIIFTKHLSNSGSQTFSGEEIFRSV